MIYGDDYEHAKRHLELGTLGELQNLCFEGVVLFNTRFRVYVIFVPDGLARRALTGHTSAASSYPVASLRLHSSQIADAMNKLYGLDHIEPLDGYYAHGAFRVPMHPFYRLTNNEDNRRALVGVTQGLFDYSLLGVPMRQVWPGLLHIWMRTAG